MTATPDLYRSNEQPRAGSFSPIIWHHVALVVDSSGGSLYVDGIEQQSRLWTGAFGATTTTQEVRIGSYPGSEQWLRRLHFPR
jgi:hypothetical protein